MKGIAHLYNNIGQMYKVMNIELFVESTETDTMINTYMTTVYEHEIALAMKELIEKGYMEQKSGNVYLAENTIKGIEAMKGELITRLGVKEFNDMHNSIDLSFVKNKPNIPKK